MDFGNKVKKIPEGAERNKKKVVKIVSKILDFGLNEQKKENKA